MYPATCAKCASVASHIDPVKLRTSFVYSESFTHVSEAQSQSALSYSPRPESAGRRLTCLTEERCTSESYDLTACDAPRFKVFDS